MFWGKKKANPQSVTGIVALATPLSYRIYDVLIENDKAFGFFKDTEEALFKHFMAASVMIAIIRLDSDYHAVYFSRIVESLERHYSGMEKICNDFNEYIKLNHQYNTGLDEIVLKRLHERVGTGDVSNQAEIEILAGGVKAVFAMNYDWFEKNDMPIK
ncbi:hypothetical protein P4H71_11045 [Paenibacillus kribbensis]|uniref:hypothetical protein n=1 Tax=Paenibacillus kribbensis TaxID=172713 RepID=UPI002DBC6B3C|nr:hypothetical protein [Paenibacillus kribbensis]MEC0234863.1 hypothetical protein [Paenibacillus kribbensis]